jgi:UrcA family protein
MSNLKGLFAGLALAAAPLMIAGAASAQPATVQVGSLRTAEDVRAFEARVDATAEAFCRAHATNDGSRVPNMRPCIEGVKAEVADKLSANQRFQIAAQHGQLFASR